ncbi:MAG: uroporphyrinogen-III synthase [Proteobacteria bacterium]|nr:uroporphyrinogen-III synthase [Pseudomonadota bacterium]
MAGNRPTLLLTRPAEPARRFLDEVRAAGGDLRAVISPLMAPRFIDVDLPDCEGIVFTSETAVAAVARLGGDRSALAWCVGPRTGAAAKTAGFPVIEGSGTAEDLARELAVRRPAGRLFCPLAQDQAFDIEMALNSAGIDTVSAVVYAQEPCPPTAEAISLMAATGPVILPLFSNRSARLAVATFRGHRAPLLIAAMTAGIAEAARDLDAERVAIASSPDAAALARAILPLAEVRRSG